MGKLRLSNIFTDKTKPLLSIYLSAGYPKLDSMPKLIENLEGNNVDFIEAGMPYSDPLADGTTIQESSSIALKNGIDLSLYFKQIKSVRAKTKLPILFMGYFNQILKTGIEKFLQLCVDSGIDGLIVPDMPPKIYQEYYQKTFERYDLAVIFLISPTTSEKRIKLIDALSSGFIYIVSSSSTTGKTTGFGKEHLNYFEKIAKLSLNTPTVIGFGIDTKDKFELANKYANGAIIGSAFIKAIADANNYLANSTKFIQTII